MLAAGLARPEDTYASPDEQGFGVIITYALANTERNEIFKYQQQYLEYITLNTFFKQSSTNGSKGQRSLEKSNSSVDNKSVDGGEPNVIHEMDRQQSLASVTSTGMAVVRSKVSNDFLEFKELLLRI